MTSFLIHLIPCSFFYFASSAVLWVAYCCLICLRDILQTVCSKQLLPNGPSFIFRLLCRTVKFICWHLFYISHWLLAVSWQRICMCSLSTRSSPPMVTTYDDDHWKSSFNRLRIFFHFRLQTLPNMSTKIWSPLILNSYSVQHIQKPFNPLIQNKFTSFNYKRMSLLGRPSALPFTTILSVVMYLFP